jgi:transposase
MSRFSIDWASKDARLREFHASGVGSKAIAKRLGVSNGAVRRRLSELGLANAALVIRSHADDRDAIAEHVANGASLAQAARKIGVSYSTAQRRWQEIRDALGVQAA